jgi:hypothetical protein
MKLSRSVKHTIRMGQYESLVFEAGVEIDTDDLPPGCTDPAATADDIMQLTLDGILKTDLELAEAALDEDSYLPTWNENKKDGK